MLCTKGDHGSILSYKTAAALQILNLRVSCVEDQVTYQNVWFERYPALFQGIGKLKDVEVQLLNHIDETVKPVAQQPRRIPFHICQKGGGRAAKSRKERHYRACSWAYPPGYLHLS